MEMNGPLVILENVSVRHSDKFVLNNINLHIGLNEQWAIVGNSGSGKTMLGRVLTGSAFFTGKCDFFLAGSKGGSAHVVLVDQQHRFKNLSNTNEFYYQQRFNASDADNSITVEQALAAGSESPKVSDNGQHWAGVLGLASLMGKPLIQLSNGENKRLQLAEALSSKPDLLVLDNPFTGLDVSGRKALHQIIDDITAGGVHVLLITTANELPDSISHVAVIEDGRLVSQGPKAQYRPPTITASPDLSAEDMKRINPEPFPDFTDAIRMHQVRVKYGTKLVLDNINWTVKKGECWNISGPNGAGKSTLLSLINADNPQAYANEIYLFDKRRGRGESIWDIKRNTGYVSPELHLFFEPASSCFDVIASGLFDTIGLFRQLNDAQLQQTVNWISLLNLKAYRATPLFQLPLGIQRMVLLARALVKNPPLLILDEPCQGLDADQAAHFKQVINQLCAHFGTTLLYLSHYEQDIPSCVTKFLRLENGKKLS